MRRAARTDSTQKDIVAALRATGAFVWVLRRPVDLLVYYRGWHVLEAKGEGWKKPRKDQEAQTAFCKTFGVPIVRTADEALAAVGLTRAVGAIREEVHAGEQHS